MTSVKEAHATIRRNIKKTGFEKIHLKQTSGRTLAKNLLACFPQPRFDNSAMDGFAVRAEDTLEADNNFPAKLFLKGVIAAGETPTFEILAGECCQIMTGAKIPIGANAVVKVEDTSGFKTKDVVEIFSEAKVGKNIRYEGEEISNGDTLLDAGTLLGPGELGIAASFGYNEIEVYRKPKISIFATGDELVEPGMRLEDGQIYNSNLHIFEELSQKMGADIINAEILKDDKDSLITFLSNSLKNSHLIVSSGGVSMGKHDYVRDALLELGVKEHFWRVAQKPGGPFFFGTKKDVMIFVLPGNPVSSFICFMEYVWPSCELMSGRNPMKKITAILDHSFPRDGFKHRFLTGVVREHQGELIASPSKKIGSHMLSSFLGSNAIIEAPPGKSSLGPGAPVLVSLLPWCDLY